MALKTYLIHVTVSKVLEVQAENERDAEDIMYSDSQLPDDWSLDHYEIEEKVTQPGNPKPDAAT